MQKQSYVGLDVSLAETSICVVDETGARLFEGKVVTDSAAIASAVRRHVVGQVVRVGLETGTTAGWLWRELIALGLPAVCLDTRHAHRALSLRVQKTDKNDARGLAELVRLGWYREAKVRGVDAQFVRSLLMARRQLLALSCPKGRRMAVRTGAARSSISGPRREAPISRSPASLHSRYVKIAPRDATSPAPTL
uniref:Transposase IS110-like N-terminal domain-containing protein n=1 Tax=Caulobacter sp. (strain K31) TaxID=366602 RepID=B0T5T7_CAUSK